MAALTQKTNPERPVPLEADRLDRKLWSTEIRVRFGDCDPAGIVYTPQFFHLFNVAIERWCEEALGLDYYGILRERKVGMGYVSAHADFFFPCTMGETLTIALKLEHIGTTSFILLLHAFLGKKEALRGRMVVVTTDLNQNRPIPIPETLRNALLAYREGARKDNL